MSKLEKKKLAKTERNSGGGVAAITGSDSSLRHACAQRVRRSIARADRFDVITTSAACDVTIAPRDITRVTLAIDIALMLGAQRAPLVIRQSI